MYVAKLWTNQRLAGAGQTGGEAVYLGDAGSLAPVGKSQPLGELSRGLIGGGTVKRHHCRRYSR
jgi:hypothetical protein